MIAIRQVRDRNEFEAVARFRYSIYVEEMNRKQKYADHARKTIVDPLDGAGVMLYAAWEGGEVAGTVRTNYLRCSDIGEYFDQYSLKSLNAEEAIAASITTRLMVHPRRRNSTLAVRLAFESYRHALEDGIATDFIDCNEHLIPFFTGLGYLVHRNDLVHPEYGAVTVMRLNTTDLDHLEHIRSPLRIILRSWNECRRDTVTTGV